jgi:hypothetical protein
MDIAIFAVATFVSIGATIYMYAMSNIKNLKANWPQYRCNPAYMPFAGLVGQDVFTNFTGCIMKNFQDYSGFMMDPIMGSFSDMADSVEEIGGAMNDMRGMMSDVRGGFLGIVGTVFGKIENLMSQFQYIIIRMRTLLARVVGIMMSFMYIFYGGMQTGESVVAGPIGKTVSFLCFDPITEIESFYGEKIPISSAYLGLKLKNGATITSVYMLVGAGVDMYTLDGVNVSGNHKVIFGGNPIPVKQHPLAKPSNSLPILVCIDTSNNRIQINNTEFLDFSEDTKFGKCLARRNNIELYYNQCVSPKNKVSVLGHQHIHGVSKDTKILMRDGQLCTIKDIGLQDVLHDGSIVRGIVFHSSNSEQFCELAPGIFVHPRVWVFDKNGNICAAPTISKIESTATPTIYYNLITDSCNFTVANDKGDKFTILDQLEDFHEFNSIYNNPIITSVGC